jgi:hypothetical protein
MTRLSTWQEIIDYTKRSETTLRKWKRDLNFPVALLGGCVESDTELIDRWFRRHIESVMASGEQRL